MLAGTSWTPGSAGLLGCLASFGQEEMGELLKGRFPKVLGQRNATFFRAQLLGWNMT